MASAPFIPARSRPAILGEPAEGNDRIARIEVRPGRREGDHLGLMLRRWGSGHWCRCDGQPAFFTYRIDAMRTAKEWIETGRA